MIDFNQFTLQNGLRVLVHEDQSTSLAVMNIIYDVGSRDENEDRTGFAHLFEHLMFGGSANVSSYDEPLQKVGGENNAFTSPDITNYYLTLPAANIETGFWLESDRMLSLSFDPEVLEVQRKVVIEEFKQRYLNQPYGNLWLKLRPLAYEVHPYKWATIGKDISHIEEATMEDVKSFFYKHYRPNNAVLVVAGNVKTDLIRSLAEKWFGPIEPGNKNGRSLPKEPMQNHKRSLDLSANVPSPMLTKAFHMCARTDTGYHAADLLSDILGRGKSSRLYLDLVKNKKLFSSISSYVTGSSDPGLLVVNGKLSEGVEMDEAEAAVDEILYHAAATINEPELEKVKNQAESTLVFSEMELLTRALMLAQFSLWSSPEQANQEIAKIREVTVDGVKNAAASVLHENNSSVIRYFQD